MKLLDRINDIGIDWKETGILLVFIAGLVAFTLAKIHDYRHETISDYNAEKRIIQL